MKCRGREHEEEDVRSHWMTLRKKEIMELERESTRRQSGELALENAMYLTQAKTT